MRTPLILTALAVVLAIATSLQTFETALAEPEVIESNVVDGDVLDSVPEFINLCFSEPVVNDDLSPDAPDPWRFAIKGPDERAVGLRIVFQTDGECVDVFPGEPTGSTEGIWTFDWLVTAQETGEEASGAITFRVGPGDPPVIVEEGDGDSIDFLLIGIIAVGAGALAVVVTAVVTRVRQREAS